MCFAFRLYSSGLVWWHPTCGFLVKFFNSSTVTFYILQVALGFYRFQRWFKESKKIFDGSPKKLPDWTCNFTWYIFGDSYMYKVFRLLRAFRQYLWKSFGRVKACEPGHMAKYVCPILAFQRTWSDINFLSKVTLNVVVYNLTFHGTVGKRCLRFTVSRLNLVRNWFVQ